MKLSKKVCILALVALFAALSFALVACNKSVVLSFVTNGGGEQASLTANPGESVALPTLKDRKDGSATLVFAGWSLNSDASGDLLRGTIAAPSGNTTYYAKWMTGIALSLNLNGGTLEVDGETQSSATVYLYEGQKMLEVLGDYAPKGAGDRAFGAWYFNGARVDENTLMPAGGGEVEARYMTTYTVSHFLQRENGEYTEETSLRQTLQGIVGERVTAEPKEDIDGYVYYAAHESTKTMAILSDDAAQNALACYYRKAGVQVNYNVNAPTGTFPTGTTYPGAIPENGQAQAFECGFYITGYRFRGWATSPNAVTPRYQPGDDIAAPSTAGRSVELYALWAAGIRDALGGGDYLFVDEEDSSVVYLQRAGIEEKKGEHNPQTGVFTFTREEGILSGKIIGNSFYYYNEGLYGDYTALNGSQTLKVKAAYEAEYNDGSRDIDGYLEYDPEWNNYVFHGADDFIARFVFGDDGTFQLQNMEEAGYYATRSGYPVIYLDGLGTFRIYFDPDHPEYFNQVDNEPILEVPGLYTKEAGNFYSCTMYFGDMNNSNTRTSEFRFKMTEDAPGLIPEFGQTFKGAFERSDLFGQLSSELYLDGFGGGTYTTFESDNDTVGTPHVGTYDVVHNWWLTEDSRDAIQVWLINFQYEGTEYENYYAIEQDRYGTLTARLFGRVRKGAPGGLSIFTNPITLGGETYSDAFIMFLVGANNESMVLVAIDDSELSSGEVVSIYAPMFVGTVEAVASTANTFHFYDTSRERQMNFRVGDDGRATFVTSTGDGSLDTITIDKGLVVDPNTSTATYTDEQGETHEGVKYTYSGSEILEFYTFDVSSTLKLYYYRESGEQTFTKISARNIVDYAYITESLANAYPARLLLAEGSNKAFIAIPVAIGEATYVGEGEYALVPGETNVYTYTNRHWVDNLIDFFGGEGFAPSLDQYHEYYDAFTFRKEDSEDGGYGKFYARNDEMFFELDNFVADGYSNKAVYTDDDGNEIDGEFYRMEIIIVFEVYPAGSDPEDSGREPIATYYLKQDEETGKMINVSEDAGLYYFYDIDNVFFETFGPESGTAHSDYIVYDGVEDVTIVTYPDGTVANVTHGKMTRSDNWSDEFREYDINDTDLGETYKIILGTFVSLWREEYLVFDRYNKAYDSEWLTEENGRLKGDGYRLHEASYDTDNDGNADLFGVMVRARFDDKDIQYHNYTVDENGDVVVFTYQLDAETSQSIVFDVVSNDYGFEYLVERKLIFGAFAYWEAGSRDGSYMYLDGNGKALLFDAQDNQIGQGEYGLAPEIDEVSYYYHDSHNASQNFFFEITIEQSDLETYFEYRRYNDGVEGTYLSAKWEYLSMGFYGEITYTDSYGVVYEGYYKVIDSMTVMLVTYDGSGVTFTFNYAGSYFEFKEKGSIEQD